MEKQRRIKVLSLAALIVAVLGLTVAFAALSQTLTINGTASVNAADWDIHFANLGAAQISGNPTVTGTPTFTGTEISGFNVSLTKPGDEVRYPFDIVNAGTIDAKLGTFTLNVADNSEFRNKIFACVGKTTPECMKYDYDKDTYITVNDTIAWQRYIKWTLYENGEMIEEWGYDEDLNEEWGFTIDAKTTRHVELVIGFDESADFVFDEPIKIFDSSKPAIQLNFVQR